MAAATVPCAIRWDAYQTPREHPINQNVVTILSPPQFRSRAPWYARVEKNQLVIDGNHQWVMDQELAFAGKAGLACWAYLWYGTDEQHPMNNGWRLHQSSKLRDKVQWVQVKQFGDLRGPQSLAAQTEQIIRYMMQPNYLTVLSGRPLWLIYVDHDRYPHMLSKYWHDVGRFSASIARFRSDVQKRGLKEPYIVVMSGSQAETAKNLGGDATTNYIPDFGGQKVANPWSNVERSIYLYWERLHVSARAAGIGMIPIAATGWDTRPRQLTPPVWSSSESAETGGRMSDLRYYNMLPTAREVTSGLQRAVSFVNQHPDTNESGVILIYAWNECDEGGNCIVPQYDPGNPRVPNTTVLDAVDSVDW